MKVWAALHELPDELFVQGTDLVADLVRAMEVSFGRRPTLEEFLGLLAVSLQSMNSDLFSDAAPAAVEELTARLARNPRKIAPATMLGIPVNGRWCFAVYLTSDRFGDALGLLAGNGRSPNDHETVSEALGEPIYSSLREIRSGRWRALGIREDLAARFPSSPEILHSKRDHMEDPQIGRFGAAETAEGRLRQLDEDEAARRGLLDGSYRVVLQPREVEEHLARVIRKSPRDR